MSKESNKKEKKSFKELSYEERRSFLIKKAWSGLKISVKSLLVVILVVGCVIGGLLIGVVAACVTTTEPLTIEDLTTSTLTSFVYYADGSPVTYVAEDGTEEVIKLKGSENVNRVLVDIEDVPEHLPNAFIAIEDERFYTHSGVDFKRSLGAVISYIVPGMRDFGGSTITQQLVKNASGDDASSIPRKVREAWRAYLLEQEYDKDEILEYYMNIIYMGRDIHGVQAAANAFFNKDVKDLSIAECAFIAGITNNPAKFGPWTTKGRSNAYQRQITILDQMLKLEMITKEEYMEAIQTELVFNEDYVANSSSAIYSYFVETAIKDVREAFIELGYTETEANRLIYGGGISIMTTQDKQMQAIVDKEYNDINNFPHNQGLDSPSDMVQASIVIIDQYTGQVKAMYGGYGEKTTRFGYNYATDAKRQPGSAIKPILVYGPQVDQHIITAATTIEDKKVFFDPQNPEDPWPTNSYKFYKGTLTLRETIAISCNVGAVTLYKDHVDLGLAYMKKSGIDRTSEKHLSMALGGFTTGVSAMEMAAAYVPFANGNGVYYEPITFTKVLDKDGKVLIDNKAKSNVVYEDSQTASVMSSLLSSVTDWNYGGTAVGANFTNNKGEKMPVAGKTGTTSSYYDFWFCGYTGYYTAAVWYGHPKQTAMQSTGSAVVLWKKVMQQIHADLPARSLTEGAVENTVECKICIDSGKLATETCITDNMKGDRSRVEIFIEGTQPKDYCTDHQTFNVCTVHGTDEDGRYYEATADCPKNRIEEVRTAQKNIAPVPCPDQKGSEDELDPNE